MDATHETNHYDFNLANFSEDILAFSGHTATSTAHKIHLIGNPLLLPVSCALQKKEVGSMYITIVGGNTDTTQYIFNQWLETVQLMNYSDGVPSISIHGGSGNVSTNCSVEIRGARKLSSTRTATKRTKDSNIPASPAKSSGSTPTPPIPVPPLKKPKS